MFNDIFSFVCFPSFYMYVYCVSHIPQAAFLQVVVNLLTSTSHVPSLQQ